VRRQREISRQPTNIEAFVNIGRLSAASQGISLVVGLKHGGVP
jgi:hypothetical protein